MFGCPGALGCDSAAAAAPAWAPRTTIAAARATGQRRRSATDSPERNTGKKSTFRCRCVSERQTASRAAEDPETVLG
jgi:hypothetical protein